MTRNYRNTAVPAAWCDSRKTDQIVARAIHAIADESRTPEMIWEAPTAAEDQHIEMACQEYVRFGDFEPGEYRWGLERVYIEE
jgi:hypothetical protein